MGLRRGPATPAGREVTGSPFFPGMTMEMAGTLVGAAVHGLIVSGAHGAHRCEDAALPGPVAVSPDAVSTHGPVGAPLPGRPFPLAPRLPGSPRAVWCSALRTAPRPSFSPCSSH